ncbi:MAG: hypothetical protein SFY80_15915 [Verrucomicrobiota bacterium]|nr:hypothetical protein [Verrucomicrobiota bacterium]
MSYINPHQSFKQTASAESTSTHYNLGAYGLFVWVTLLFGYAIAVLF